MTDYPEPSIQEAAIEFTKWARHAQSYRQWFVEACPSEDMKKIVVTYRPNWIDDAERDLHAHSTFMMFPVIMKPNISEASIREAVQAHERKCPGCGYPCVRCHGK